MNEFTSPVDWTEEEDQILLEGKKEGLTHKEIGEKLVGRTALSVRGRWLRIKDMNEGSREDTFSGEDLNHMTLTFPPGRIITLEKLLEASNVDLDVWEVERYIINKWEVGRKGTTKDLVWDKGSKTGYTRDSGQINVEPLYQVKVWLLRKVPIAIEPVVQPVILKIKKSKIVRARKSNPDFKTALIIPDLQVGFERNLETNELNPFHDRDFLSVTLALAKDMQPDNITLVGDNMDLSEWSDKFIRSPEFYFTTQPAINELSWWLSQFRLVCPDAEMYYIEGNHESRMEKSIVTHMAAAYHLRPANEKIRIPVMSIPHLLNLDALDIEWVGGYPDGTVWLNDGIRCVHGDKARSVAGGSAKAILESSEVSVVFGHIHRTEVVTRTRHTREGASVIMAMCPGCGCRLDGSVPGNTLSQNWSQGLAKIYYDNSTYNSMSLIDVQYGTIVHDGKLYESNVDIKEINQIISQRALTI